MFVARHNTTTDELASLSRSVAAEANRRHAEQCKQRRAEDRDISIPTIGEGAGR
jgi:hypothetical protein